MYFCAVIEGISQKFSKNWTHLQWSARVDPYPLHQGRLSLEHNKKKERKKDYAVGTENKRVRKIIKAKKEFY